MESFLNHPERIKCIACNTIYSKMYMSQHHKTLKHFENVCELEMEMDAENYLNLGPETEEEN